MSEFRFSARPNKAHLIQWRPWREAAFAEAKAEGRPILLEIVAYWCGACQRMDEVTLSDDAVIALINERFIPIRVEEAQRPDIDARYTSGGWPTLAVLTPSGDLLVALNSLGPVPMVDVLAQVSQTYTAKSAELELRAAAARQHANSAASPRPLVPSLITEIADMVQGLADPIHGGYGLESKFPHPDANELFLYLYEVTGAREFLEHVRLTLRKMRSGSLHDWEGGGGYFRYASRRNWEQPHPEKLLGDQAGLLGNFLHAYLLSNDDWLREASTELVNYLDSTLLDAGTGAFFGCQDFVRRYVGPGSPDSPLDSYLDECIYTDLNALAASAYLQAWWLLGREDCRARAVHILDWQWRTMHRPDGAMYHYWADEPLVHGLITDVTATGSAMLDAYSLLGEPIYLERALELGSYIVREHFSLGGGYSDIPPLGPDALAQPITFLNQNAKVASLFTSLADLTDEPAYREAAHWALWPFDSISRHGVLASGFAVSLARYLARPTIATITGPPGDPRLRSLAAAAMHIGRDNVVLKYTASGDPAFLRLDDKDGASATFSNPEDVGLSRHTAD